MKTEKAGYGFAPGLLAGVILNVFSFLLPAVNIKFTKSGQTGRLLGLGVTLGLGGAYLAYTNSNTTTASLGFLFIISAALIYAQVFVESCA
jgi:hypothetical protein